MTDYIRLDDMNNHEEEEDNVIEETNVDDDDYNPWNIDRDDDDDDRGRLVVESIPYEIRNQQINDTREVMKSLKYNPNEYSRVGFINYLIDTHEFKVSHDGRVEYYAREYNDNIGGIARPYREIIIKDGEIVNDFNQDIFDNDIDRLYNDYKSERNKREIRRDGLFGGVVVAITGLISGLVLGLKKRGRDIVKDSGMRWKRLPPAEKKKIIIPWTELEKASGRGVIIIGKYFYVILGGLVIIYMIKE